MSKMKHLVALALALGGSVTFAAPPTPSFNAPVKLAEGNYSQFGSRLTGSGASLFAAVGTTFEGADDWYNYGKSVRLVRSTNGGATWELSQPFSFSDPANQVFVRPDSAHVAVTRDPAVTGQQIVHVAWDVQGSTGSAAYYSSIRTAAPEAGWSAPVLIRFAPAFADNVEVVSILPAPNGSLSIFTYEGPGPSIAQYTAPAVGQPFGAPSMVPVPAGGTPGQPSIAIDSAGTFHVAFTTDNLAAYYAKRVSGASWTTPVLVARAAGTYMNGNVGIAVANTDTVYVAYVADSFSTCALKLATSANGGASWSAKAIPAPCTAGSITSPAVVASSSKVVTVAWTKFNADGTDRVATPVARTADGGATWSGQAALPGGLGVDLLLDAAGKVNASMVRYVDAPNQNGPNGAIVVIREK